MENSAANTSETPNLIAPDNASVDNLWLSFGNLRVRTSAVNDQAGTSLDNSAFGSPINGSSTRIQQAQVDVEPNYGTGFQSSLPVPMSLYPEYIWSSHSSSSRGNFLGSNLQSRAGSSMGSTNYTDGYGNNYQQNNFVGDLTGNTIRVNSGFGAPSTPNWANQGNPFGYNAASVSQGGSNYMFNNNLDLNHTIASQNSSQSNTIGQTGLYLGNGYHNSTLENSGGSRNQQSLNYVGFHGNNASESCQGYNMVMLAMTQNGSQYLQNLLTTKDQKFTDMIIAMVLQFIDEFLIDQYGHHLFGKVVESCNEYQLQQVVAKITLQKESLIKASLDRYGARSIKRLIKVLEKSPLVSKVTSILSSDFYRIMISQTGSYVIVKCLDILDTKQNESLHKAAINHCIELATHENGCIALNNCINYIKGPHRNQLLDLISSDAVHLSKDPLGNYVVQQVLGLHNPVFTKKICSLLKGHYILLSLLKGGSHVVEKCLNSPEMQDVVKEFLDSKQLLKVARDQYGNYVIQTALTVTMRASSPLHELLSTELQRHSDDLRFGYGRNVMNLINLIDSGIPISRA